MSRTFEPTATLLPERRRTENLEASHKVIPTPKRETAKVPLFSMRSLTQPEVPNARCGCRTILHERSDLSRLDCNSKEPLLSFFFSVNFFAKVSPSIPSEFQKAYP